MPVYLKDLPAKPDRAFIGDDAAFAQFQGLPDIQALNWPTDVLRQWIWDHGAYGPFLKDYAALDLSLMTWELEKVPTAEFMTLRTGASDGNAIEEYAADHGYWMELKAKANPDAKSFWEEFGTWAVPPVTIDRCLVQRATSGLQLVEGRTRVGVLRGRRRAGLRVARSHDAWVARRTRH